MCTSACMKQKEKDNKKDRKYVFEVDLKQNNQFLGYI